MNRQDLTRLTHRRRCRPALPLLALTALLLALTACQKPATRRPSEALPALPMEEPEATQMARALANQQALALYRCEPFVGGPSAVWTNEHWLWRARQALGEGDMEAVVSLAADGSTQSVQVLLLHSSMKF